MRISTIHTHRADLLVNGGGSTPTPDFLTIRASDTVEPAKLLLDAANWFRKAAEQGDADAQFHLGHCYHHGEGVTKDAIAAVMWYRKAAEQNYVQAQCNLALCYYHGEGVTKSPTEAVKWFRRASEQGCAQAQFGLGVCYGDGFGVVESRRQVQAIAHCYEPRGETGRHGGNDWFSQPWFAGVHVKVCQGRNRRLVGWAR